MAERALATAFVNIVPGTQQLEQYLKKDLGDQAGMGGQIAGQKLGSGLVDKAKSFIGPLLATFSAVAVTRFVSESVTAASDLNEAGTAATAIFGDAVGKINKWAQGAATSLGQSNVQAIDAAKSFGIFGQAAGLAADDNAAFSMELGNLSADFASFYNATPDEAITAIGAALRGEAEPIRRFGVLMNDATLKAEAMKLGLIDSTKTALTPQQKILAAHALIMNQSAVAQGDFAKTSEGMANQQRIAAAQVENLKAKLGAVLLPVVTNLISVFNDKMMPAIEGFITGVKDGWAWIQANSSWLMPLAVGLTTMAIGFQIANTAATIAAAGGLMKYLAATKMGIAIQAAWNAVMAMNPLTIIIIAIVALVAALVWFFTQTELGQQIWQGFVDAIGMAWNWLWESVLKPVFDFIAAAFQFLWDVVISPIVSLILLYIGLWAALITFLWEAVIQPVFKFIGDIFNWLWTNVIKKVIDFIVDYFKMWGKIITWIWENVISPVFKFIGGIFDWLWKSVIEPVIKWITGAFEAVGKTVSDVFGGIGKFIKGVFDGILTVLKAPINAVIDFINLLIDGLNLIKIDIPDWVPGWGGKKIGFDIPHIPKLAKGGFVDSPTTALIGEAGPEVVTPLKDFERMMGIGNGNNSGKTINYYAAPNQSLDADQALFDALKRAKVLAGW